MWSLFLPFSRVQSYQRKKLVYLVVFVKLDCGAIHEERISFFACKDSGSHLQKAV
jgi:hypothetical protein